MPPLCQDLLWGPPYFTYGIKSRSPKGSNQPRLFQYKRKHGILSLKMSYATLFTFKDYIVLGGIDEFESQGSFQPFFQRVRSFKPGSVSLRCIEPGRRTELLNPNAADGQFLSR